MAYDPDPVDPARPWYNSYWGYYNRPYRGCGCLYTVLIFALLWFLLSLFIPALAIWDPYLGTILIHGILLG